MSLLHSLYERGRQEKTLPHSFREKVKRVQRSLSFKGKCHSPHPPSCGLWPYAAPSLRRFGSLRGCLNRDSHFKLGHEGGTSNAILRGTQSSTSVPPPVRLRTRIFPPILLARSRMPGSPQCPSRPDRNTAESIPQPSSCTRTRKSSGAYCRWRSMNRAPECLRAL